MSQGLDELAAKHLLCYSEVAPNPFRTNAEFGTYFKTLEGAVWIVDLRLPVSRLWSPTTNETDFLELKRHLTENIGVSLYTDPPDERNGYGRSHFSQWGATIEWRRRSSAWDHRKYVAVVVAALRASKVVPEEVIRANRDSAGNGLDAKLGT